MIIRRGYLLHGQLCSSSIGWDSVCHQETEGEYKQREARYIYDDDRDDDNDDDDDDDDDCSHVGLLVIVMHNRLEYISYMFYIEYM